MQWGLGVLGPAILCGPLQGCDPTFPSWGSAVNPRGVRGRAPEVKHFGNNILKSGCQSGILVAVYTQNSDPISDDKKE